MMQYCTKVTKQLLVEKHRLLPFVNGKFVLPATGTVTSADSDHQLYNPATAKVVHDYDNTSPQQIQDAIDNAAEQQKLWFRDFSPYQRSKILLDTSYILKEKADLVAKLETLDTGRPIQETAACDVASAVDCLQYYAGLCLSVGGQTLDMPSNSSNFTNGNHNWAYTRREPLGVTAGIGAWNYPLQSAIWKAAPALAFGNSMVYKPSEVTPLTSLLLAESLTEAGLPDGVFNVVLGDGAHVGNALISNANIQKVAFTGSLGTGQRIYENAARLFQKPPTMELGGKSPLIIYEDVADTGNEGNDGITSLDDAVSAAMMANWYSSGQVCSNGTRVFVQESIHDEFLSRLLERTAKLNIGDPFDDETQIGPMVTKQHMEKIQGYIRQGINKDGATLVYGDSERLELENNVTELQNGYYLKPCIFVDCHDDMSIVKEEIFGMVMCVLKFKTEEEVVERANNTEFGLSAGVFTNNLQRAHRTIAQLEAGTTWINHYNLAPAELPWSGVKKSGIGYENGIAGGADSWTEYKSVMVEMNGNIDCPYD